MGNNAVVLMKAAVQPAMNSSVDLNLCMTGPREGWLADTDWLDGSFGASCGSTGRLLVSFLILADAMAKVANDLGSADMHDKRGESCFGFLKGLIGIHLSGKYRTTNIMRFNRLSSRIADGEAFDRTRVGLAK